MKKYKKMQKNAKKCKKRLAKRKDMPYNHSCVVSDAEQNKRD